MFWTIFPWAIAIVSLAVAWGLYHDSQLDGNEALLSEELEPLIKEGGPIISLRECSPCSTGEISAIIQMESGNYYFLLGKYANPTGEYSRWKVFAWRCNESGELFFSEPAETGETFFDVACALVGPDACLRETSGVL